MMKTNQTRVVFPHKKKNQAQLNNILKGPPKCASSNSNKQDLNLSFNQGSPTPSKLPKLGLRPEEQISSYKTKE